jgi:hypothetical protein
MLKIVLLAYSQGLISSRTIEQACQRNVQFIAISGDSQPSHAHIAKFVANLSSQIKPLFSQVLMTCDAQGLIGREMFAIDGVKLPSNASKERSGTHEELRHRADGAWTRRPTRSWPAPEPRTTTAQETAWSPNAKPAWKPCARKRPAPGNSWPATRALEPQRPGTQDQRHRPPKRQDGHQQRCHPGLCGAGGSGQRPPGHRGRRRHRLGLGASHAAAHDRAKHTGYREATH